MRPRSWCSATRASSLSTMTGLRSSRPHDQVLRNHTDGSTCSVGLVGTGVADPHPDTDVVGGCLGVVDGDVPVAVVVEDAGVEELELGVLPAAGAVLGDQAFVRELALRVDVGPAHPGVGRRRVQVPPQLLGVLAVVALVPGQPEDPLLQDRIGPVPERQGEAQPLLVVAQPGQAVLVPAVGAGAGVIVGQVPPRVAVRRCSPLGPCPRPAPTGRAPTASTPARRRSGEPARCSRS